MDVLMNCLDYLDDPYLVVRFQRACGIIREDRQDESRLLTNQRSVIHGDGGSHYCKQNGAAGIDAGRSRSSIRISSKSNGMEKVAQNGDLLPNGNKEDARPHLDYRIENKALYYLFNFGAALGNDIFYITFFPFFIWNMDSFVARRVCLVWWIIMYIGQVSKDLIKRPRPPSPPVVKLEKRYALEYGMPSTHAMVGTCLPFSLLILTYGRYQYPFMIGLTIAVSWTILVGLSRIYLGMHSVLDVIAGVFLTLVLLPLLFPMVNRFDEFQVTHPLAPVVTIGVPLILSLCYPKLERWSTTRGDTTLIVAIGAGISCGSWLNYQQGMALPSLQLGKTIPFPSATIVIMSFLRLCVGVMVLVFIRKSMRELSMTVVCRILGLDKNNPKVKEKKAVELPNKFCTYFFVALAVTYIVPLIFKYLGLARSTFYTELCFVSVN